MKNIWKSLSRIFRVASVLLALSMLGPGSISMGFAQGLSFTTIDLPSAVATPALGINAREDVVGFYVYSAGLQHGFLLRKGTLTTIDFLGALDTGATGMILGCCGFTRSIQRILLLVLILLAYQSRALLRRRNRDNL